jgi:2'-5' RNA ligase
LGYQVASRQYKLNLGTNLLTIGPTSLYFIALVLPGEAGSAVHTLKVRMRDLYGCVVALRSPAHITLVPPFHLPNTDEERLTGLAEELVKEVDDFQVRASGFASFGERTLFISVPENSSLNRLKDKISEAMQGLENAKVKPDTRPFHPHITIATRDIRKGILRKPGNISGIKGSRRNGWLQRFQFSGSTMENGR